MTDEDEPEFRRTIFGFSGQCLLQTVVVGGGGRGSGLVQAYGDAFAMGMGAPTGGAKPAADSSKKAEEPAKGAHQ